MAENEALIKYKYNLCKNFLNKLAADGLITKQQYTKISERVAAKLANKV